MPSPKPPHLNIRIRQDQRDKLEELIPWGIKRAVMECWIDVLLKLLEGPNGRAILGSMADGHLSGEDLMRLYANRQGVTLPDAESGLRAVSDPAV